jgi:ABC-type uncharacterized transport system permease subunit
MMLMLKYALLSATVLMLVALGGCYSEHSGVINLALEGIMVIGGLMGAMMLNILPETMAAGSRSSFPSWSRRRRAFCTPACSRSRPST